MSWPLFAVVVYSSHLLLASCKMNMVLLWFCSLCDCQWLDYSLENLENW